MKMMKKESGQSMVEFVLTLVLVILLLFGIIDFAYLYETKLQAEYAVAEAARAGMAADASSRESVVRSKIASSSPLLSDPSRMHINVDEHGGEMTVEMSYNVKVLTPVGGVLFPTGLKTINSKCVIKVD